MIYSLLDVLLWSSLSIFTLCPYFDKHVRRVKIQTKSKNSIKKQIIQLVACAFRENLFNRSSGVGVQISRDICARFARFLYSAKCSWIIIDCNSNLFVQLANIFILKPLLRSRPYYKISQFTRKNKLWYLHLFFLRTEPVASSYRRKNKKKTWLDFMKCYENNKIVSSFSLSGFNIQFQGVPLDYKLSRLNIARLYVSIFQRQCWCSFFNLRKVLFVWGSFSNTSNKRGRARYLAT